MSNIVYLDNAATTFVKPQEVHDFMHSFYSANSVNVGRGNHSMLNEGTRLVKETRQLLLEVFNATIDYEAVFTSTATEAINVILQGQDYQEGDNIYISPFEHNAVYRVVKHIEKTKKVNVEILAIDAGSLELDIEVIKGQFANKPPKMVAVTHVSNVCGNVLSICELGEVVSKTLARLMVDCAQSAGLLETDIIKCRADYMVFAGHKTLYGPFGCSGFVCKKTSAPKPLIYGGTGIDSASEDMPKDLPTRYEAGSQNIMAIAGLNASLKWIKSIGREEIQGVEKENYNKLYELLSSYDFIKIIGKGENSTSIISCTFEGLSPDNVAQILSDNNIIVRTGLHCAPLAHKTFGTYPSGTVRFSIGYYTDQKDMELLNKTLLMMEE